MEGEPSMQFSHDNSQASGATSYEMPPALALWIEGGRPIEP